MQRQYDYRITYRSALGLDEHRTAATIKRRMQGKLKSVMLAKKVTMAMGTKPENSQESLGRVSAENSGAMVSNNEVCTPGPWPPPA